MSSSDGVQGKKLEELCRYAREGYWGCVLETYKEERKLRTKKITEKGDTFLHLALSKDAYLVASEMISILEEAKNNVKDKVRDGESHVKKVLRAKNFDGETALFLAALHGNKSAFLRLYYLCKHSDGGDSSTDPDHADCIKRNNNDTILHCAIEHGHIDVAIEIFHLYRDDLVNCREMKRNNDGLSPLHLLVTTPSAFKSTSLHGRFIVVHLLYQLISVKEKKAPTTEKEVRAPREHESFYRIYYDLVLDWFLDLVCAVCWDFSQRHGVKYSLALGVKYILALLGFIILVLLALPMALPLILSLYILALFLLAGKWLHGIRKMKQEHTWYGQIMNGLLDNASSEEMSKIKHDDSGEWLREMRKMEQEHEWCGQIMNELLEHEMSKIKLEDSGAGSKIVETPLMIAAKNGAVEMVKWIVEKFPWRIEDVNDEKKNIVLVAAEKGQRKLYQFLLDQKGDRIPESAFSQIDKKGNTALHLAAMSGANLNWQTTTMIEESKWFELVKKSVPSNLRERLNDEGKRAEGIFRAIHGDLMKGDLEWLHKTSQACSVVSTLVATMVIPNVASSSGNSGKPILINKFGFEDLPNPYLVTLSLSLMSTISFLGILASRFQSISLWTLVPLHASLWFVLNVRLPFFSVDLSHAP
ncbi:uncharacterized protein LOC129313888 [Prosopis cineraria]|uniref:uncharacterized protein LOC129313888 n=1 Tax=Prosopis cineraria TaxID=364024 RepID=UPI00240EE2D5|nr:uncharacterized protein LOC129313888 [Prosopis cineraria]